MYSTVKADITSNPLALVGSHGFTLKNLPTGHGEDALLAGPLRTLLSSLSFRPGFTILVSAMTAFVLVRNRNGKHAAFYLV